MLPLSPQSRIDGDSVRATASEEWRDLPAIGNYRVSNQGRVFSGAKGRVLTGTPIKGYTNVRLGERLYPIHRLVCLAFHGMPDDGMMAGHLDGNPQNNRADNLAWITRSENTLHSIAHGTFAGRANLHVMVGEEHPSAKLTVEKALEIRASPLSYRALAAAFGVSRRTIEQIRLGKRWRSCL